MSIAFKRFATESCATKRATMSSGKRGAATSKLTGLKCTPLDPVDPETRERMGLPAGAHELLQTFVEGAYDILAGDLLTYNGIDYPVRAVAEWKWRGTTYRHLILEELK